MRSISGQESAMNLVQYRTCHYTLSEWIRSFCARRLVEAIVMFASLHAGCVTDVDVFRFVGVPNI